MYKSRCYKCNKEFRANYDGEPYRSQAQANVALRMHIGRVHSHTIPTASGGTISRALRKSYRRRRANELVTAGNGQTKSPSLLAQVLEPPETARVDRRTKAYRLSRALNRHLPRERKLRWDKPVEEMELNFCPRCKLNLAMLRTAMTVALRHS